MLAGVIYFTRPRSAATSQEAPQQASLSSAGYVDPAICASCHADVWETYRRTGMGRSFSQPVLSNTIGDNKSAPTFYHKPSESYFTMLERDGRFYQRRYQIGFDGKETNIMEKEIDFVVGSGNHVRAYLHRTSRNKLVELPLARYAEKGGSWAMNPGYDHQDHPGFSRTITYGCMFCHNGFPEVPAGSGEAGADTVFPGRLPEGIDCQRCHGPGGKHVQAAESGAKPGEIRKAIVNPSRLSPERQMEVCMQCHLETTSSRLPNSIVRYGRSPFSYRPGEPLGISCSSSITHPAALPPAAVTTISSRSRARPTGCDARSVFRRVGARCSAPPVITLTTFRAAGKRRGTITGCAASATMPR